MIEYIKAGIGFAVGYFITNYIANKYFTNKLDEIKFHQQSFRFTKSLDELLRLFVFYFLKGEYCHEKTWNVWSCSRLHFNTYDRRFMVNMDLDQIFKKQLEIFIIIFNSIF